MEPSVAITPGLLCSLWLIPAITIAMRCGPDMLAAMSYLMVAAYALSGRRQAIVAFFLMFLFTMINHGLGAPIPLAALLRWVVIFSAAISVVSRGPSNRALPWSRGLLFTTVLMPMLIVVHSIFFSSIVDVSILKAFAFGLTIVTLAGAWSWESPTERRLTEIQLLTGLAGMAIASIPLLFTSMGYFRNTKMFMGVLAHAQSFGPTMALLAVVLLATWLTTRKISRLTLFLLPLSCAWMYLSQARISVFAFVGGIGLAALLYPLQRMTRLPSNARRILLGRVAFVGGACLLAAVFMGPSLFQKVNEFIRKGRGSTETLSEAAMSSRGFLIEKMQNNIRQTPLTGIGFGVPSDPDDRKRVARDPILGLAISAPVEKGVMPIAAIEELGIPLAAMLFAWMTYVGLRSAQGGFVPLAVFLAAMLTNAAEATFFSPGALGGLILLFVTWAATSPGFVASTVASRRSAAPPHASVFPPAPAAA